MCELEPGSSEAEVHQPARLPASEAELDAWSVYGDALLGAGDPKGEWIARDLALPALVDDAGRAMLREYARATQQRGLSITWSLGHIKELALARRSSRGFGQRRIAPPAVETMRFAIEQLRRPAGRLVECISLSYAREVEEEWAALMAALPPTCTRMVIAVGSNPAELVATLPPQVRKIAVDVMAPWQWHFIADRFDVIDATGLARASSAISLRETRSVVVRVATFADRPPASPRIVLGGDGEGAIVHVERRIAHAIPRWRLFELQETFGPLGARELIARSYLEAYDVRIAGADVRIEPSRFANLSRRGEVWEGDALADGWQLVTGDVDAYTREHFA